MTQQEYQQEIDFIFNRFPSYQKVGKVAYKPGIETMQAIDSMLGAPHRNYRTIHVAGTNGKGSTSHMLAAALQKNCKVGLYTSPYVRVFNERMRVNGENISDEKLARLTEKVKAFAEKMADRPTEFELITAIAFEFFKEEKCDIVVLEVGLGGRLDATNIIKTPTNSLLS